MGGPSLWKSTTKGGMTKALVTEVAKEEDWGIPTHHDKVPNHMNLFL